MASFVREVLSAAGQLSEKEDFNGKALKLKNRVDSLKFQMREKIESRLVDLIVFTIYIRKTRQIWSNFIIFLSFFAKLSQPKKANISFDEFFWGKNSNF